MGVRASELMGPGNRRKENTPCGTTDQPPKLGASRVPRQQNSGHLALAEPAGTDDAEHFTGYKALACNLILL